MKEGIERKDDSGVQYKYSILINFTPFLSDHDGAEPSGNSISVHNLLRLEAYLQRSDFKEQAEKLLAGFTSRLIRIPEIRPEMVSALMFYHDGPTQVQYFLQ